MNIELSRHSVKASKVNKEKLEYESDTITSSEAEAKGGNNNKEMNAARPVFDEEKSLRKLKKTCDELQDKNKFLIKQLTSRDEILKRQLAEIQRLKLDNKQQIEAKTSLKNDNERLEKELEAEKWLSDKLKQDIRDLQVQLGFEECYLQEQTHQIGIMEALLEETQKRYQAQNEEITELRKQLDKAKMKLDNQIFDLQNMLSI